MWTRMALGFLVPCVFTSLVACDKSDKTEGVVPRVLDTPVSSEVSLTPPAPSSTVSQGPTPAAEQAVGSLELQELTFTNEVKNKEPDEVLLSAEPGMRVWAHLRLRNRFEETQKIRLEFRVNGEKRTTIELKIDKSWSYRTWAFNTLQPGDKKGSMTLEVRDESDKVLAETSLPIEAKARKKPYVKGAG